LKEKIARRTKTYKTIKLPVTFDGIGVHSGEKARVELIPSTDGVIFMKRGEEQTKVIASVDNVVSTEHGTTIGNGEISYRMVEHVLAVLNGFDIDGMTIVVDNGDEIPILDGSALLIAEKLKDKLLEVEKKTDNKKHLVIIENPFVTNVGKSFIGVYPSTKLVISYFINYDKYPELTQMKTVVITPEVFIKEIAPARTYAFAEWVEPLRKKGLIKGGNLDNSVVYSKDGILNRKPLRFEDEFVRHKILDFLGDLSLLDSKVIGHFVVVCGGHSSHITFLKQLKTFINRE
jgi:UDP-3-O-[3-hydroxymyristoyl] N-acetylglucosamine deacetylase